MSGRICCFDQMKGVAIILVVIGHLTQFCFGMNSTDVNRWLEIFHMPVFFFISGYFSYKILTKYEDIRVQLWKKIRTITIPLLVWCVILTFNGDETLMHLFARCCGKYWFLYTLTILSVFFIFYDFLIRKVEKPLFYIVLWGVPFVLLVVIKLKYNIGNYWIPIDSLVNYYRYYLVGFLCKKYLALYKAVFLHPYSFVFAFLAFAFQFIYVERCFYILIFLGAMGGIVLLHGFFMSFDEKANKNSFILSGLTYLGTKTLPVYLIHYFFIPDMKVFKGILESIGNPFIVHLVVCLLLALMIIFVCLVIERIINVNRYLACIMFGKALK